MNNRRDDFSLRTKRELAIRAGLKCSNPSCRHATNGANEDSSGIINIGVAAHICAAAKGGPRYDENMSSEERKSPQNGIWLCQTCASIIDRDPSFYTKELLTQWKEDAEAETRSQLKASTSINVNNQDKCLINFYLQCFDRPAFQDDIYYEGQMEDFDKAIEDTLIALNTGVLKSRDGTIIKTAEGKSAIQNISWRKKLDKIAYLLSLIQRKLKKAQKEHAYVKCGSDSTIFYCFYDHDLGDWFNQTRREILEILSSICREAGLKELIFQNRRYDI